MSDEKKPSEQPSPLRANASQDGKRALAGYLPSGSARPARILCYEEDARSRKRLRDAASGLKITLDSTGSTEEFSKAIGDGDYDVALISIDRHEAEAVRLATELTSAEQPICVLLTVRKPTVDHGVLAMRCGAVDLIAKPFDLDELRERLASAAERAQSMRQQARRIERLKRICRRLNKQRQQVNNQVDVLCGDLVNAYQQLAEQVDSASVDQLAMSIESELDVESLLRKTLEYMLTKTGPTNAAVYLPGNSGDFSLGAYVNYDLPKDTADTLLDHLADIVPSRFRDERSIVALDSEAKLVEHLDDNASWLSGSSVIATGCHSHDGDCLAVLVVFRDRNDPFSEAVSAELRTLRDAFSRQLAKVVRVHNRATPKAEWLGFDIGDEPEEDEGMTDWGWAA
ncbi:MAG: hypothetical protein ABL309_04295 [Phycisphaerales bacterium]